MTQIFSRFSNLWSRLLVIGCVLGIPALSILGSVVVRSDGYRHRFMVVQQPVPFSHRHHVGQDGIDCRYCHVSVETSAFAGLPSTDICMSCHSQLWTHAPVLEPVRRSMRTDEPIRWQRVHDLPDFVFFNHSIHVHKGIGCESCHGRVDRMPLTYPVASLRMTWCLECHRNPEPHLRPRDQVFQMGWQAPADQLARGRRLARDYHLNRNVMVDCYTCHR
jgi:hypothetical protein